jgi:hypothetical protein
MPIKQAKERTGSSLAPHSLQRSPQPLWIN